MTVGKDASFQLIFIGGSATVDDVLEGGDTDFFEDPAASADYFALVQELRQPGSSARGKDIVLWTARPVKDRLRYSTSTVLPSGVFLTSDPARAEGLSRDLGSGTRDLWRAVVNTRYLVRTLKSGRVEDWQVIAKDGAPMRTSMDLVQEGDG